MDEFRAKLHQVRRGTTLISPCIYIPFISIIAFSSLQVPLDEYFPEYTGGTDADEGARCILTRFRELNHLPLRVYTQ